MPLDMLGGKAGVLHLHVGNGRGALRMLLEIVEESEIPISQFTPTHLNRSTAVLDDTIRFAVMGGMVDITTSIHAKSDGREIVVSSGNFLWPTELVAMDYGLSAIDVATRQRRPVLRANAAMQPNWSPHGTRIAYWGRRAGGQRDLWTVAAGGSEATTGGVSVTK